MASLKGKKCDGLLAVLLNPWYLFVDPWLDAPDCESRSTVEGRGSGMQEGAGSAVLSLSEIAEPYICADGMS